MADHEMKANDLLPVFEATLGFLAAPTADTDLGTALADAGTSVSFIMRKTTGATQAKVNSPATVVDAPTRLIRYAWVAGDTDSPGDYSAEIEVTHPDGKTQTFPTSGYLTVKINADLDEAS